jgi:hypothetical protein
MDLFTRRTWRPALVAAGLLTAVGGSMHPDADGSLPMREELAIMTADPAWVPGHTLVAVGTVLVTVVLVSLLRAGAWGPSVRLPLLVAGVAMAAYSVETVLHLAAVVDSHALAHGHAAPVADTHVGLAVVLYPVSGLAVAWLSIALVRTWRGPRRLVALPGVAGGLVHAVSLLVTFALPTAETSPVFAAAGMLMSLWALLLGLGAPSLDRTVTRSPAAEVSRDLQPAV